MLSSRLCRCSSQLLLVIVAAFVLVTISVEARSSQHHHHVHKPSHTKTNSNSIIIADEDTVPAKGESPSDQNLFPTAEKHMEAWKSAKLSEMLSEVTQAATASEISSDPVPLVWSYGENEYIIVGRPEGIRNWFMYVPESYKPSVSVTLVLTLHGLQDNAQIFAQQVNITQFAETEGFIVLYPQGSTGLLGTGWNAGTCCVNQTIDDLGFIMGIIARVNATFPIRQDSIHSMGMSNGAFMSESLGCHYSDVFTSIGSVAGDTVLLPGEAAFAACDALFTTPLSYLHIHGTADPVVPIPGEPFFGWPPIGDDVKSWAKRNACPSPAIQTLNVSTFTNYVYQDCATQPGGVGEVQLVLNAGAGHIWPSVPGVFETTQYILDFWNRVTPGGIAPVPVPDRA